HGCMPRSGSRPATASTSTALASVRRVSPDTTGEARLHPRPHAERSVRLLATDALRKAAWAAMALAPAGLALAVAAGAQQAPGFDPRQAEGCDADPTIEFRTLRGDDDPRLRSARWRANEPHEFYFTRAIYTDHRSRGGWRSRFQAWSTDWPKSDQQFIFGLRRLTDLDAYACDNAVRLDRKSTRLNSSHVK